MMPILAKTDDVRSGRKANARHGRHRITIQYCLKIDFGICAITDTAFGCARQANHGRRNPGKNLDVLVCQTLSVFFKGLLAYWSFQATSVRHFGGELDSIEPKT